MSLAGLLETNLLGVQNLRSRNVGERVRTMRVLDRLAWTLGPGRASWPVAHIHRQLDGTSDAAVIRVHDAGPRIAEIECVCEGWFEHGTEALPDWPNAAQYAAWCRALADAPATRVGRNDEPIVAWSIETHIFTVLKGWTEGAAGHEQRARATRVALRRQIAKRFHDVRRALIEAAGPAPRRAALAEAFAILAHARWVATDMAQTLWRADAAGERARRFALRYPMGFALAAADAAPGERPWDNRIGEIVLGGGRERDALDALAAHYADTEDDPRPSRARLREIFALREDWTRRYERARGGVQSDMRRRPSSPSRRHTRWIREALALRERRGTIRPERAALEVRIAETLGLADPEARQAAQVFANEAKTRLARMREPEEMPPALEAEAARWGVPLRPTERRIALTALELVGEVANEVRDARQRIADLIAGPADAAGSDADAWTRTWVAANDDAKEVWDRLWGRAGPGTGSFRRLIECTRRWASDSARVGAVLDERMLASLSDVRWESPRPRLARGTRCEVHPVTDARALVEIAQAHRNCADGKIESCTNPHRALHVYVLKWPSGRETLLGVIEEREKDKRAASWLIADHRRPGNKAPSKRERRAATTVLEAIANGDLERRYAPRRAERRRVVGQALYRMVRRSREDLRIAQAKALLEIFPELGAALEAHAARTENDE